MADTAEYAALRRKVLDWTNRDAEVFNLNVEVTTINDEGVAETSRTPDVMDDFLKYAADKAYRVLRVPALEKTHVYTITDEDVSLINNNCLPIPSDLTEFISLSKAEGLGVSENCPLVYNQKVDYRTFRDSLATRTNELYWTRFGGQMLISPFPGVESGDKFELYYYGRAAGGLNGVYPDNTIVIVGYTEDEAMTPIVEDLSGMTIPNWLRDENERILLFGALSEAFSYLGEDDMQAKYLQMFQQEIDELNREEEMRKSSGGNYQVQYNSFLI